MAKYITAELHKKFSKLIPELPRKTTLTELWNAVYDKYEIEGELTVDTVKTHKAVLEFTVRGETRKIVKPVDEIYTIVGDDCKSENYEVLIKEGLEQIAEMKLWKKSNKKKEKN